MIDMPQLESQRNRPLQMTFEDHLEALVYFHLEEHHSAQHLLQVLEQDDFARNQFAPEDGIKESNLVEKSDLTDLIDLIPLITKPKQFLEISIKNRIGKHAK